MTKEQNTFIGLLVVVLIVLFVCPVAIATRTKNSGNDTAPVTTVSSSPQAPSTSNSSGNRGNKKVHVKVYSCLLDQASDSLSGHTYDTTDAVCVKINAAQIGQYDFIATLNADDLIVSITPS